VCAVLFHCGLYPVDLEKICLLLYVQNCVDSNKT